MSFFDVIPTQLGMLAQAWEEPLSRITLQGASYAVGSAEMGFYAQLRGGKEDPQGVFNWIRHNTVNHINTLQPYFNTLNGVLSFYTVVQLTELLGKKIDPLWFGKQAPGWIGYPIVLSALGGTMWILSRVSAHLSPAKIKGGDKEFKIVEKHSYAQRIANQVLVIKMIAQVAFAALQRDYIALFFTIGQGCFSLFMNFKVRWLFVSKQGPDKHEHDYPHFTAYKDYTATVRIPLLPFVKQRTPKQWVSYCSDSWIEKNQLLDLVKEGLRKLTSEFQIRLRFGEVLYTIDIDASKFPSCKHCQGVPKQHRVSFRVDKEIFIAKRKDTRDGQALFERIFAAYCIAKAGLSYLRGIPEWSQSAYTLQTLLLAADLIGLGFIAYFLSKQEKGSLAGACLGGFLASSHFLISKLNQGVKEIDQLNPPFPEYLMQWVGMNSLLQTGLLLFFSKSLNANLLSFAAQLYSFNHIYQLKGIR